MKPLLFSGKARRRSVAARIVSSYFIVLIVFAAASVWSIITFRQAVSEAALLRTGYLPLALSLRDLVSNQDTWNSQLNHVTTAQNPTDAEVWFETALSVGRPKRLRQVEEALQRALPSKEVSNEIARGELSGDLAAVRRLMASDSDVLSKMFEAMSLGDISEAQARRDELVLRGARVRRRLGNLETRVAGHVDGLVDAARRREQFALRGLALLGLVTLLVGVLMALYARRVLRPLSQVTRRADAVAHGDLSVQEAIDSGDEIGELSATFEGMVRAIADARERLLASERLAAIGKMAAHVTHEVRNPLSSIALNLDLLEEELSADDSEARSLVRAIGQEVARLSRLSDQYLSMARRKAPEMEECELGSLLSASVQFMRPEVEGHGIHLESDIPPDLPWAQVDEGQIRQVLFNLVRNAQEAMPEGGQIAVRARKGNEEVIVEVSDTGPGVQQSKVDQLFDPFFTTKDHGTGLGLAVTRQILTAHGGELIYAPAQPHGSVFSVHIPILAGNISSQTSFNHDN